jgi:hypothetical protein
LVVELLGKLDVSAILREAGEVNLVQQSPRELGLKMIAVAEHVVVSPGKLTLGEVQDSQMRCCMN